MSEIGPIALTMGEPAGIGGELSVKLWAQSRNDGVPFFVIDDPNRLAATFERLGVMGEVRRIEQPSDTTGIFRDYLPVLPLTNEVEAETGYPSTKCAAAVLESIEVAASFALSGDVSAVVTNPIHKQTLYDAGFKFPGHTEYLAELSESVGPPVMMLASPRLRVVPVTVHVPLRRALDQLSTEVIVEQAEITAVALKNDFGIVSPRLAIAGLNPHAGESGMLGTEEHAVIEPAIAVLREKGIDAAGPVPPDALFTERARETFDAAICMYHDQALIPIKALDFDEAVNVTLGLPIVRTSPDHGTALNIAGKGIASPASLSAAMKMATDMARNRSINIA